MSEIFFAAGVLDRDINVIIFLLCGSGVVLLVWVGEFLAKRNLKLGCGVMILGCLAVVVCGLQACKHFELKKEAREKPFQTLVPTLIKIGVASRNAESLASQSHKSIGKVLWLDLDSRSIAPAWWELNDRVRAITPDELKTLCFSSETREKVGVYEANSGDAFHTEVQVWLVDYQTTNVVGRKTFQSDPPASHRVRVGETRDESGRSRHNDVMNWLERQE